MKQQTPRPSSDRRGVMLLQAAGVNVGNFTLEGGTINSESLRHVE